MGPPPHPLIATMKDNEILLRSYYTPIKPLRLGGGGVLRYDVLKVMLDFEYQHVSSVGTLQPCLKQYEWSEKLVIGKEYGGLVGLVTPFSRACWAFLL